MAGAPLDGGVCMPQNPCVTDVGSFLKSSVVIGILRWIGDGSWIGLRAGSEAAGSNAAGGAAGCTRSVDDPRISLRAPECASEDGRVSS